MYEKFLSGLATAETPLTIETLTKLATEKWLEDTLTSEQHRDILAAAEAAFARLNPPTVAETAPATPATQRLSVDGSRCQRCGGALTNVQVMMGVQYCVECARQARER